MNDKEKSKKNKILTLLFVILNILIIVWIASKDFNGKNGSSSIFDIDIHWKYLILGVIVWLISIASEILKFALIQKEICNKMNWKVTIETVLLGRYYDNITPSGFGGQPFQIYNLNKNGVKITNGTAICLSSFLCMQISFIIIGLLSIIFGMYYVKLNVMKITSFIGLFFYSLFPLVIILVTFFPKFVSKIFLIIIAFLEKIKIIKNKKRIIKKFGNNTEKYSDSVKLILKNKILCLKIMILGFIYQITLCSLPFFAIRLFGGNIGLVECFIVTISIYATITLIPTPGNSGAAEGSFYGIFSMLSQGSIFWAMLIWRFFVFYSFIVIGGMIYLKKYLNIKSKGCINNYEKK